MTARHETQILATRLGLSEKDANTLRLAQLTLHRWAELECGDSNSYASCCIVRDETTNVPYRETYPHNGGAVYRVRVNDKETAALKRVMRVCSANGLHFYHQTDPRGCSLYVSRVSINGTNYSGAGFPCVA